MSHGYPAINSTDEIPSEFDEFGNRRESEHVAEKAVTSTVVTKTVVEEHEKKGSPARSPKETVVVVHEEHKDDHHDKPKTHKVEIIAQLVSGILMGLVVGIPFGYFTFANPDRTDGTLSGVDPHCWAADDSTKPENAAYPMAYDVTAQFETYFAYNFYIFVASFCIMIFAITAIVMENHWMKHSANFL